MNISASTGINSISGMVCGGGIDEEYKRIIEKMLALGLTPSGNKAADKAKLREVEMQQIKTELGARGKGTVNTSKYVTVSAVEIEQLKEKLQQKEKDENSPEMIEKREAAHSRTGAEQQALLNKYFICPNKNSR